MGLIYHIAAASDWKRAQAEGTYTTSTRGVSLADEGFIHASQAHQVASVADRFYRGEHDLVLLTIDEDLVIPEIRYEPVPGSADPFPHIYGPLNVDAVQKITAMEPDAGGWSLFGTLPDATGSPFGSTE